MNDKELIYLMDPHCGWCFGYSNTISEIHDHVTARGGLGFRVVPGGFFIPRIRGSAEFADDKRPIAERIEGLFGVEFSPSYFDNVLTAPWIDSTPSNQAIHACNIIEPARALALSKALTDAAFAEGRDISQTDVVLQVAVEQELEPSRLSELMVSQQVDNEIAAALSFSAHVATGFPSVFLRNVGQDNLVHLGGADLTLTSLTQTLEHNETASR